MRPAAGPCLYFSQACSSGLLRGEYFHTDRLGEHPRHSVPEHAASVRRCSTYFKYPVVHIVVHCSLFMNTVRLRTLPHCAPVHQFLCSRILSVYPDPTPAGSRAARTCECRASGAFLNCLLDPLLRSSSLLPPPLLLSPSLAWAGRHRVWLFALGLGQGFWLVTHGLGGRVNAVALKPKQVVPLWEGYRIQVYEFLL